MSVTVANTAADLTGQTLGILPINLATQVTGRLQLSNLVAAVGAGTLLGRRSGSAGDWEAITVGSGLSLSGSTLTTAVATTTRVIKSANESVTSSTTLQDDNELLFAVGANQVWHFRFVLFTRGSTSGDIKVGLTVPSGSTKQYYGGSHSAGTTGGSGNWAAASVSTDALTTAAFGTMASDGSQDDVVFVEGIIQTAGTAGTVQLQWAQNTSNGTATTVLALSFLVAVQVS